MALELTRDFPELDNSRLFSPIALARVTGLASTTRRLWRTRGLVPFDRRDDGSPSARHRSSWTQAVQYAVMTQFITIGVGQRAAGEFADFQRIEKLALVDFRREGKNNDVLVVGLPAENGSLEPFTQGAKMPLNPALIGGVWLNFSAIQRQMIKRYLKIRDEVLEELE